MSTVKVKPRGKSASQTNQGKNSSQTWFKPGNPGGPGRPRKEVADAAFGVLAETVTPEDWQTIVQKWVARAKRGDLRAIEALANRLMGLPQQPVEGGLAPETMEFLQQFYKAITPTHETHTSSQDDSVEPGGVSTNPGGAPSP